MAVRLSARHSLDLLLLHGGRGVGVVLLGRGDRLRVALGEALEPRQLGHIAAREACCLKRRAAFWVLGDSPLQERRVLGNSQFEFAKT